MADLKQFADQLVNLTVKEVNDLATILKDEYGIEPAAAAVVVSAGGGDAGAGAEEQTEFTVVLKEAGASFNPKPVNSLTALTTANLEAPASFNTTVNSVCSSAPAPASPPQAETTTAAAAGSIPYSSFNIVAKSLTSFTVKLTN